MERTMDFWNALHAEMGRHFDGARVEIEGGGAAATYLLIEFGEDPDDSRRCYTLGDANGTWGGEYYGSVRAMADGLPPEKSYDTRCASDDPWMAALQAAACIARLEEEGGPAAVCERAKHDPHCTCPDCMVEHIASLQADPADLRMFVLRHKASGLFWTQRQDDDELNGRFETSTRNAPTWGSAESAMDYARRAGMRGLQPRVEDVIEAVELVEGLGGYHAAVRS